MLFVSLVLAGVTLLGESYEYCRVGSLGTSRDHFCSMRAVRIHKFGGVEELKVENIPVPKAEAGEVLIRVFSVGVNPADTYIRAGDFGPRTFPLTLGSDAAGVVEEVGDGVTEFKKGDRVYTVGRETGAYAEYTVAVPSRMGHLDDNMTFAQGASIGVPYYTAWKALYFRAQAKPKETILVHGASGAVGIAAVQMAKANGHRVIGTAGTKEGLELVLKQGADLVFNHREEGYVEKIKASTGDKGVDVILEMLANVNLNTDLDLLGHRGRVVIVGCRGEIKINPAMTMGKETSIMGVALTSVTEEEWQVIRSGIQDLHKTGHINPVVAKEYKLDEVAKAHHDIINNSGTFGKLVLDTTR
ncbi:unnamed protein product [Lymnaea stagnalis]|uniref:Enoyl reductase (ER) domain-containing protein n=1 Tax=Lymnaea stagnalis TaxID=6523 RepID=A0AAV2H8F0_LYMST